LEGADRCLAARTGAFDKDFDLSQAMLHRFACCRSGSNLRGVRSALARSLEPCPPALLQAITLPLGSVKVTIVLLNVA